MSHNYETFEAGEWGGINHREWKELTNQVDRLLTSGEVVRDRPAMKVRRVATPQGTVYVKHWLQGGPGFRLLSATYAMQRRGFNVPMTLLAAEHSGQEVLVTLEVPGILLRKAIADAPREEALGLIRLAARATHELHSAHFIHGDLLPGNLMLTPERRIVFIDNDRTRRAWPWPTPAQRRRNLEQMVFRLFMSHGMKGTDAFLDAYFDAAHFAQPRRRRWRLTILRRVRWRIAERRAIGRKVKGVL